jgi:hypothetical protein
MNAARVFLADRRFVREIEAILLAEAIISCRGRSSDMLGAVGSNLRTIWSKCKFFQYQCADIRYHIENLDSKLRRHSNQFD